MPMTPEEYAITMRTMGSRIASWDTDPLTGTSGNMFLTAPPKLIAMPMSFGGAANGLGYGLGTQANGLATTTGFNWSNPFGILTGITTTVGYAALAFGAYRMFVQRRRDLLTIVLLALGLWKSGLLNSIIPKDSGGNIDILKTAAAAILPTSASGLLIGGAAMLLPMLAKTIFGRKRTYRRSYARRYRRPSNRWYNRTFGRRY